MRVSQVRCGNRCLSGTGRVCELVAFLLVAAVLMAGCGSYPASSAGAPCNLHVAWDPYEPYSYSGKDDLPIGFDIDVIREVAGALTVGTGYKADRSAWSWYSESYRKEVIGLLVREGSVGDFPGATVDAVLESGLVFGKTVDDTYTAAMEEAFSRYPKQIKNRVSEAENVQRLLSGSIDGFLVEVNVASALVARLGVTQAVEFHGLAFDAGSYRLQMSKKTVHPQQLARINAAIQQLAQSGWLDRRIKAYGIHGINDE